MKIYRFLGERVGVSLGEGVCSCGRRPVLQEACRSVCRSEFVLWGMYLWEETCPFWSGTVLTGSMFHGYLCVLASPPWLPLCVSLIMSAFVGHKRNLKLESGNTRCPVTKQKLAPGLLITLFQWPCWQFCSWGSRGWET